MKQFLSKMFLVAATLAASSASAGGWDTVVFPAFDKAVQLYAKLQCKPAPEQGRVWRVEVTIEAIADDDGVVRASRISKGICLSDKEAPEVRWPELFVITVPEGDKRSPGLAAFDPGVRMGLLAHPCADGTRSMKSGKLKAVTFKVRATVGRDGVMRTDRMSNTGCDWRPLSPSG